MLSHGPRPSLIAVREHLQIRPRGKELLPGPGNDQGVEFPVLVQLPHDGLEARKAFFIPNIGGGIVDGEDRRGALDGELELGRWAREHTFLSPERD